MNIQPVIKWTGSKRYLAPQIVSYFPKEIDTYYEPFCGSCAVMMEMLINRVQINKNIKVKKIICSDVNPTLISFFNQVKDSKQKRNLISIYEKHYYNFVDLSPEKKKEYYNKERDKFNRYQSPENFIFLNKVAQNGLIRYNKSGEFNASCNTKHKPIYPKSLAIRFDIWWDILNQYNVQFIKTSFVNINPTENDFMFLDPPYSNIVGDMYYHNFEEERFWQWIKSAKSPWALTYNAHTKEGELYELPIEYDQHIQLEGKSSNFRKLHGRTELVYENLYLKGI